MRNALTAYFYGANDSNKDYILKHTPSKDKKGK